MARTAKVFNHSRVEVEQGKETKCPRCSGSGSVFPADDGNSCRICNGYGRVWLTPSGWTRAKYARIENSQLY